MITLSGCLTTGNAAFNANTLETMASNEGLGGTDIPIPDGFCFSDDFGKRNVTTFVALLHSCGSGGAKGFYSIAVISKNTTAGISTPESFRAFFFSAAGNAQLGNTNGIGDINIVSSQIKRGIFYLELKNTEKPRIPNTQLQIWKAFFEKNGQIYVISYHPMVEEKNGYEQTFGIVQNYALEMKRRN